MITHCPLTGVNLLRFAACIVTGFIFLFGLDFALHAHLLTDLYAETANLWRSPEEMQEFFTLTLGYEALLVILTAFLFTRNFEDKGIMEGIRFGFLYGLILALLMGASYIWMPIPLALAGAWAAGGLVTGLGLGIINSLLYKA